MAGGGFGLLCLLAVFSVLRRPGCCQYQQIVLGNSVNCNTSSVYTGSDGTSADCTGAINGNTDTTWHPTKDNNPNCVFTVKDAWPAYWFLNLGQSRAIHRITIYHVHGYTGAMRNVQVRVDGREVFTYPDDTSLITNPTEMFYNFPVTGQIIKIERTTQEGAYYLPLCEVQLWECERYRYGRECAYTCSANCQDNGRETICNGTTGACIQGCVNGRYGPQCTSTCARNCEVCDRDSGACTRCVAGWHGNVCDTPCSENCSPDNHDAIACEQDNGRCISGCVAGWHGNACDTPCSDKCSPDNRETVTCEQDDGRCSSGCVRGYYGVTCQYPCGKGCVNNNCSRQDGACTCLTGWSSSNCTECNSGYYGVESCEACGYCRDDDVCNNHNGHCPRGCRDGFDGDLCNRCAIGYYGVRCHLLCGKGCVDNNCSRQDGACTCLTGWSPPYCVVTASESSGTQDGGDIVGPVVGSVLGAGALIGLSILLAAIIRRQRSRDAPTSRDSDERGEAQFSPEGTQARVDTEGLKTETSDAETHYESLEKYENPDDIKPYSTLETDHGRRTNVNIQGDKAAVLYHNITSYKT